MIFKWETEQEKIQRYIKISPKKKLEWLYEMNRFTNACSTDSIKRIRQKLRESR